MTGLMVSKDKSNGSGRKYSEIILYLPGYPSA
jgi:hypothetical protein